MPIFEFRCRSCGDEFEQLIRNGEAAHCPECNGNEVEKLMSAPAGHVAGAKSLPVAASCPPPEAGPCGPGCCRLPM